MPRLAVNSGGQLDVVLGKDARAPAMRIDTGTAKHLGRRTGRSQLVEQEVANLGGPRPPAAKVSVPCTFRPLRSFSIRRPISAPARTVWRPWVHEIVSWYWYISCPRPCGKV